MSNITDSSPVKFGRFSTASNNSAMEQLVIEHLDVNFFLTYHCPPVNHPFVKPARTLSLNLLFSPWTTVRVLQLLRFKLHVTHLMAPQSNMFLKIRPRQKLIQHIDTVQIRFQQTSWLTEQIIRSAWTCLLLANDLQQVVTHRIIPEVMELQMDQSHWRMCSQPRLKLCHQHHPLEEYYRPIRTLDQLQAQFRIH